MSKGIGPWLAVAVLWLWGGTAWGHPTWLTSGSARVERDGAFVVELQFDVLAYALGETSAAVADAPMNALLDGPEQMLRQQLQTARIRWEAGAGVECEPGAVTGRMVTFPGVKDVRGHVAARAASERLPVVLGATIAGRLPPGAREVRFRFPPDLGTVVLTVERVGGEPYAVAMEAGAISEGVPVEVGGDDTAVAEAAPSHGTATFWSFTKLGFEHIVPKGIDHILFVLGLFLLSVELRPLLWQVTAFTVAHSITLALSLYGVVRLPASAVEPLIALSIAFVAAENLFTTKLQPWRPLVVFAFGLVHGLGFAGILQELHLPRGQFLPALVGFNVGVEAGQLVVIGGALLVVGWWRERAWYRAAVAVPASVCIAGVGLFWTVQRIVAP